MSATNYLQGPITQQGGVFYNARCDHNDLNWRFRVSQGVKDVHGDKLDQNDVKTIQRHDPVLMRVHRRLKYGNTNELYVTACTNGITRVEDYEFAGIARTRCVYDDSGENHQDELSVQVGGLCTTRNTGNVQIFAGQYIVASFDPTEYHGKHTGDTPKHKCPVILQPYVFNGFDSLTKAPVSLTPKKMNDLQTSLVPMSTPPDPAEIAKNQSVIMQVLGDVIADKSELLRSKIIGRALSNAEPGKPFDMILGSYMC